MKQVLLATILVFLAGCSDGFRILNTPLSPTTGAWTVSADRSYFVLGNIELENPPGLLGSSWCLYEGIDGRADCISDEGSMIPGHSR